MIKSESTVQLFKGECLQCCVSLDVSTLSCLHLNVKPLSTQGKYRIQQSCICGLPRTNRPFAVGSHRVQNPKYCRMWHTPKQNTINWKSVIFLCLHFPSGVLSHSFALQYFGFVLCDLQLQRAYSLGDMIFLREEISQMLRYHYIL